MAEDLKDEMTGLVHLFDDVVGGIVTFVPLWLLHFFCKLFLRSVRDAEEMEELRGIAEVTGLQVYLLVTLNVLLDVLLGCSSGGARVVDPSRSAKSKMVHFRTLDWGMTELRRVVVRLDFIKAKGQTPYASSITYAGFVGVLTGVRKDLSLSLNFRRTHNDSHKKTSNLLYALHQVLVLLGWRPSIASVLRRFLLNDEKENNYDSLKTYILTRECRSTACYLTLCNGSEVTVLEKDRITALARSSKVFENVTNHDESFEGDEATLTAESQESTGISGMKMLLDESVERRACMKDNYSALLEEKRTKKRKGQVTVEDMIELVQRYPCLNECTHYALIMDPQAKQDRIVWCRRWTEPIEGPDQGDEDVDVEEIAMEQVKVL